MKLVIQIPCLNEEETLPIALNDLPRSVPGVDTVEWQIIDDGSTDRTVEVARQNGVDHVVSLPHNQGLARAFMAGLHAALGRGADIIVNTDADNQYNGADIEKLVAPIVAGQAEIVIGTRPIAHIKHFSPIKKFLQKLGSLAVRLVSSTKVPDAPSGFRAISRNAAMRLNVFNKYTYTLETIIQAGQNGIRIASVDVRVNDDLRPSRLVKSIWSYVMRSLVTIFRIFMIYKPLKFFVILGSIPFTAGFALGVRWLALYFMGTPRTHVPSLILAAILMLMGVMAWLMALVADVMAVNRKLLEDVQYRMRRNEYDREHDR